MKVINLPIVLPDGYKWIARQPFGTWIAFKTRPEIIKDEAAMDTEYWGDQDGEMDIGEGEQGGNWRQTLRQV